MWLLRLLRPEGRDVNSCRFDFRVVPQEQLEGEVAGVRGLGADRSPHRLGALRGAAGGPGRRMGTHVSWG